MMGYRMGIGMKALLAALLVALGCSPREAAPPPEEATPADRVRLTSEQVGVAGVRVEPVVLREVCREIEVPATVSSPDTALVTVASLVEGRVESVGVVPGDHVEAGTPLLLLHSHELTDALRDRSAAQAQLAFAEAALGRSEELLAAGAIAREEVERRRADRDALAAELARAEEWVAHLDPDMEGHVVVRAPRAGTVFEVSVHPGGGVTPGAPLVTMGRTDVLWVKGWVPEREGIELAPGTPVRVRFGDGGTEAEGRVVRMGGAVDPVRRAVEIRVELASVPPGVLPGGFATLLLPASAPTLAAVLPAAAVQRMGAAEVVFVEHDAGVYHPVSVRTVALSGGEVAVEGVQEGQNVVVGGAYAIRSAMEQQNGGER